MSRSWAHCWAWTIGFAVHVRQCCMACCGLGPNDSCPLMLPPHLLMLLQAADLGRGIFQTHSFHRPIVGSMASCHACAVSVPSPFCAAAGNCGPCSAVRFRHPHQALGGCCRRLALLMLGVGIWSAKVCAPCGPAVPAGSSRVQRGMQRCRWQYARLTAAHLPHCCSSSCECQLHCVLAPMLTAAVLRWLPSCTRAARMWRAAGFG